MRVWRWPPRRPLYLAPPRNCGRNVPKRQIWTYYPYMRKAILPSFLALLALVLPAAAAAQIVPPGNSAAAQYTETIPTSQGEKNAQGPKQHVNPNDVIGSKNTKKLEEQGPEGAAVAEFTAETAPTTSAGGEESSGGGNAESENGGGKPSANGKGNGNGTGDGKGNGNGSKPQQGSGDEESSEAGGGAPVGNGNGNGTSAGGSGPSGSSAVGEVASQATGVSSGALGLWLPIVLVAVVLWAAFMVWRRHEGSQRAV